MNEEARLLWAIADEPADDLPRLVYADWLDDAGQVERAEFVRVQLELARQPCEHARYFEHCGSCRLQRREWELLGAHGEAWMAAVLPGWGLRHSADWVESYGVRSQMHREVAFWRGLPAVLFLRRRYFEAEAACLARQLASITRVQLVDCWPRQDEHHLGYRWVESDHEGFSELPHSLWNWMPPSSSNDPKVQAYPTEPAALAALSRACVLYARHGPPLLDSRSLLSIVQVAELCEVTPAEVRAWIDARQLVGYRIPGTGDWRIGRDQFFRFLKETDTPSLYRYPDWGTGGLEGD